MTGFQTCALPISPLHDDDHDSDRVIPVRYRVAVPVVSEQRAGIDHEHVLLSLQDALR